MVAIKLKSRVNKQVDESNYEIKTDNYNIFEKAKTRSFSAEIENDKHKSKMLLERTAQAKSIKADQAIIEQEEKSAAVYKRALLLIGSGDLQITSNPKKKNQQLKIYYRPLLT